MAKGRLGILGAFTLGFGAGAAVAKWWPVIEEKLAPVGRQLLAKGLDAAEQAKATFWRKSEKVADLIADIKEEQEAKLKGNGPQRTPGEPLSN